MKKLLFTLVASAFAIANANAQDSFATFAALEHNGNITTFTGGQALQEAVAAADDGDVITLSAGEFKMAESLWLTKSLTLRGAGMDIHTNKMVTRLSGSSIYIDYLFPEKTYAFEGLDIDTYISVGGADDIPSGSLTINKCVVSGLSTSARDVLVTDSKICMGSYTYGASVRCHNSVLCDFYSTSSSNDSPATYTSCIAICCGLGTYENCVCAKMYYPTTYYLFTNYITKECIYIRNGEDFSASPTNENTTFVDSWTDVFGFEFDYDNPNIRTEFVRSNNFVPKITMCNAYTYSPTLNLPTIKNLTVAKESTADGKLSIDVEIED